MVGTVDFAVSVVITAGTKVHATIDVAVELLQPVDTVALILRNINAIAALQAAGTRGLRARIRVADCIGTPGLAAEC
jgi:hypothetical protein